MFYLIYWFKSNLNSTQTYLEEFAETDRNCHNSPERGFLLPGGFMSFIVFDFSCPECGCLEERLVKRGEELIQVCRELVPVCLNSLRVKHDCGSLMNKVLPAPNPEYHRKMNVSKSNKMVFFSGMKKKSIQWNR